MNYEHRVLQLMTQHVFLKYHFKLFRNSCQAIVCACVALNLFNGQDNHHLRKCIQTLTVSHTVWGSVKWKGKQGAYSVGIIMIITAGYTQEAIFCA